MPAVDPVWLSKNEDILVADQTIVCPHCGKEIPLTETLFHQVEERLRKTFEEKTKERDEFREAGEGTDRRRQGT